MNFLRKDPIELNFDQLNKRFYETCFIEATVFKLFLNYFSNITQYRKNELLFGKL